MYFRGKACSENNTLLEMFKGTAHMELPGNGLLV